MKVTPDKALHGSITEPAHETPAQQLPATLFGQPRGLATLFLTETWERFTHYGMRAILVLFMVTAPTEGGLGINDKAASSIYGVFVASCYLLALPGGWIADRLLGAERTIVCGGAFILLGNAMLACGNSQVFFLGLAAIALGVGLLKPNVSVLVGHLYPEGGARRDAGFSLFYMGINVGALLGAVLVPVCAARFGWRWGFALSTVVMFVGLVQFLATRRYLRVGPIRSVHPGFQSWLSLAGFMAAVIVIAILVLAGKITIDPRTVAIGSTWLIGLVAAGYFAYLLFFAGLSATERNRVYVMVALFIAVTMCYAGIEQTGTSLTFFADRYTERDLLGWHIPAGVFQGVNSVYIILLAPWFSALWIALDRRGWTLSTPVKFAIGLILMAAGFLVMYVAATQVLGGAKVLATWLILSYGLQMCGDLCLAPVGLSSMTKLAAPRVASQVMGMWFLSIALGNDLAGQFATGYDATNPASMPTLFLRIAGWCALGSVAMLIVTPQLKRLMMGVK